MENTLTRSLIDTNILVYANNEDSPYHKISKELIEDLLKGDGEIVIAIQNLIEFYAITTDSKRVENPLTPMKANELLEFYTNNKFITIIYPTSQTPQTINKLIDKHKPRSQKIFDYLLAATMQDNGVCQIYTSNTKHFKMFEFLKVINPLSSL